LHASTAKKVAANSKACRITPKADKLDPFQAGDSVSFSSVECEQVTDVIKELTFRGARLSRRPGMHFVTLHGHVVHPMDHKWISIVYQDGRRSKEFWNFSEECLAAAISSKLDDEAIEILMANADSEAEDESGTEDENSQGDGMDASINPGAPGAIEEAESADEGRLAPGAIEESESADEGRLLVAEILANVVETDLTPLAEAKKKAVKSSTLKKIDPTFMSSKGLDVAALILRVVKKYGFDRIEQEKSKTKFFEKHAHDWFNRKTNGILCEYKETVGSTLSKNLSRFVVTVGNGAISHSARDGDGGEAIHEAEKLALEWISVRQEIREHAGRKAAKEAEKALKKKRISNTCLAPQRPLGDRAANQRSEIAAVNLRRTKFVLSEDDDSVDLSGIDRSEGNEKEINENKAPKQTRTKKRKLCSRDLRPTIVPGAVGMDPILGASLASNILDPPRSPHSKRKDYVEALLAKIEYTEQAEGYRGADDLEMSQLYSKAAKFADQQAKNFEKALGVSMDT
jgi:hypothetical protein